MINVMSPPSIPSVQKLTVMNEQTWLQLGQLSEIVMDDDYSIRIYEMATKYCPNNLEALFRLGKLYTKRGKYLQAVDLLLKYLGGLGMGLSFESSSTNQYWATERSSDPNFHPLEAYICLGFAFLGLEDIGKSYSAFQQASIIYYHHLHLYQKHHQSTSTSNSSPYYQNKEVSNRSSPQPTSSISSSLSLSMSSSPFNLTPMPYQIHVTFFLGLGFLLEICCLFPLAEESFLKALSFLPSQQQQQQQSSQKQKQKLKNHSGKGAQGIGGITLQASQYSNSTPLLDKKESSLFINDDDIFLFIYFDLAKVYSKKKKLVAALACFEYAIAKWHSLVSKRHKKFDSISILGRDLSLSDIYYHLGIFYERASDLSTAETLYTKILKDMDETHIGSMQRLAWILLNSLSISSTSKLSISTSSHEEKEKKGLSLLKKALELSPNEPYSHYLLGRHYAEVGAPTASYDAYQQAVYRDPRQPIFWNSIGLLYLFIQQYRDALDAFIRAIHLFPGYKEIWINLGVLYESCNHQYSDALDAYTRAEELDPMDPYIKEKISWCKKMMNTDNGEQQKINIKEAIQMGSRELNTLDYYDLCSLASANLIIVGLPSLLVGSKGSSSSCLLERPLPVLSSMSNLPIPSSVSLGHSLMVPPGITLPSQKFSSSNSNGNSNSSNGSSGSTNLNPTAASSTNANPNTIPIHSSFYSSVLGQSMQQSQQPLSHSAAVSPPPLLPVPTHSQSYQNSYSLLPQPSPQTTAPAGYYKNNPSSSYQSSHSNSSQGYSLSHQQSSSNMIPYGYQSMMPSNPSLSKISSYPYPSTAPISMQNHSAFSPLSIGAPLSVGTRNYNEASMANISNFSTAQHLGGSRHQPSLPLSASGNMIGHGNGLMSSSSMLGDNTGYDRLNAQPMSSSSSYFIGSSKSPTSSPIRPKMQIPATTNITSETI